MSRGQKAIRILLPSLIFIIIVAVGYTMAARRKSPLYSSDTVQHNAPPIAETPPVIPEPPQRTPSTLVINWLPQGKAIAARTLGFSLPQEFAGSGLKLDEIYQVMQVGSVTSEPFKGLPLLHITRPGCDGPCGSLDYRVIGTHPLMLLQNLSHGVLDDDVRYFTLTTSYDIADLHPPKTITTTYEGNPLTFVSEYFSPSVGFDWFKGQGSTGNTIATAYGNLYEFPKEGYFGMKLPDQTIKLYQIKFPFAPDQSEEGVWTKESLKLKLQGGGVFSADYYIANPLSVCPPRNYIVDAFTAVQDTLRLGGTLQEGSTFYESKDVAHDPQYASLAQGRPDITPEEIAREHAIIYWNDPLGRVFTFLNTKYGPVAETECGYMNSVL